MNKQDDLEEIDLLEIFFAIRKRIWIILAAGLLFAILTGIFTHFFVKEVYSSNSKLYILTRSTSITSLADIQVGTSLTKDYIQLAQSRPVVEEVIANLKLNRTYEQLLKQMTFTNPSDTRILVITAEDPDPVLAKDIVDEFAHVASSSISTIMKTDEPSIVELGYIKDKPVSPNLLQNVLIGFLLGVFLSAGVVVVLYLLDDTVKTSDDIEKYLGLNTLTVIPVLEGETEQKHKFRFGGRKDKKNNGK